MFLLLTEMMIVSGDIIVSKNAQEMDIVLCMLFYFVCPKD